MAVAAAELVVVGAGRAGAQVSAYRTAVLANSPSVYYRLGEAPGATSMVDSSGNARNGVYQGGTLGVAGTLVGDADSAVTANGPVGQYVSGAGLPSGAAARSVESWFKTTASSPQDLLSYGSAATGQSFGILLLSPNVLSLNLFGVPPSLTFPTVATFNDGNWHHVVLTYDGNVSVVAYLDGLQVGSGTLGAPLGTVVTAGVGLRVGSYVVGGNSTIGGVDEVAVYPSALTPAQVAAHFTAAGVTRPSAPGSVSAVPGVNSATVTWSASTANVPAGQVAVSGYVVTALNGATPGQSVAVAGAATSVTVRGLQSGVGYSFKVTGLNGFGTGAPGASAVVTPSGNASTYASAVFANGPSVFYRFSEAAGVGVMADSSGNGRNGRYQGGTLGVSGGLISDPDTAVTAAGPVGQFLSGGGLPTGAAARSVESWFKTTSVSSQDLVSYGSTGTGQSFGILLLSPYQLGLNLVGIPPSPLFQVPVALNDGNWHYVVMTYDGNVTVAAYVDGTAIGSSVLGAPLATVVNPTAGLRVGVFVDGIGNPTVGTVDDVAVYPTVLSPAQVAAHFAASGDTRPSAPGSVTAAAGVNQVVVSWVASTAAVPVGQSPVSGYVVSAVKGAASVESVAVPTSATTATLGGLQGSVGYSFKVTATNGFGTGVAGTSAVATPSGAASTYASAVSGDTPSLYFRLGEPVGVGVMADSSGNGRNGVYNGGTLGVPGAVIGDSNSSVAASGSVAQYVGAGGLPSGASPRSIEVWFNTTSPSAQDIVSYGTAATGQSFGILMLSTNQLGLNLFGIPPSLTFPTPVTLNDGNWHHVVLTYDGTVSVVAYLDGTSVGTGTLGAPLATLVNSLVGLRVGVYVNGAGNPFSGGIDDVAVYPTVLNAAQVAAHFNAGIATIPGAPTGVTAKPAPGGAVVTWTPPVPVPGTLTGYTITATPTGTILPGAVPITVTQTVKIPRAEVKGLVAGQAYVFTVKTVVTPPGHPPVSSAPSASSPVVTAGPIAVGPGGLDQLTVRLGYDDHLRTGAGLLPWAGSPNTTFIGGGTASDSGAVLIFNPTSTPVSLSGVTVTIGPTVFNIWGSSLTVPGGGQLILTQTADNNFDTSDIPTNTCTYSGLVPQIAISAGSATRVFQDSGRILNTGGKDANACTGQTEFTPWAPIGTSSRFEHIGLSNPAEKQTHCGRADPVDCGSGAFNESITDVALTGGRGAPLSYARTYSSLAAGYDSRVGFGWSDTFNMSLAAEPSEAGNSITVVQENGSQVPFAWNGTAFVAPARVFASLVANTDGTFLFSRHGNQNFVFNNSGQLIGLYGSNGTPGVGFGGAGANYDVTTLTYNGAGQLSTVTDATGRTLTMTYWAAGSGGGRDGRLKSVADQGPRTVTFDYTDGQGNLTDVVDVYAGHTKFTYDTSHRLLTQLDANQFTSVTPHPVTNHYDSVGRVDSQTDQLGRITTFDYTTVAGATITTDPKGNKTLDQYNGDLLTTVVHGYGTAVASTTTHTYDDGTHPGDLGTLGITRSTTTTAGDANNHQVDRVYDANGNATVIKVFTDATNFRQVTTTYNSFDEQLTITVPDPSATGPATVTSTSTYDTKANLLTTTSPLYTSPTAFTAQTTTYHHDDATHPEYVTSITDPDAKTTTFTFDAAGNVASAVTPLGNKTTMTYDTLGRLKTRVSPKGNVSGATAANFTTTFGYDTMNRLVSSSVADTPAALTSAAHYDLNGNPDTSTDGNLKQTVFKYNLANELIETDRPDTTKLFRNYWPDGTLNHSIDAAAASTSYTYDTLGRVASMADPLNRTTSYTYDATGSVKTVVNASSQTTTNTYNNAGDLVAVAYSDGVTPNATYTYGPSGKRATMIDGTGTSTYTYDSLGRQTNVTNGAGATVGYGYNLRNLVTTLTYPGSTGAVTRGFDDDGRWASTTDWFGNTTTFGYDPNDNMLTSTLPAGTGIVDTNTFSNADEPLTMVTAKGAATLGSFTYTRDPASQVKSVVSVGVPADTHSYTYTALEKLAQQDAATFSYSAADNLTKFSSGTVQAFDVANQLCASAPTAITSCTVTPSGTTKYAYDVRGNRTTITPPTGPVTTLLFDQANRLTVYGTAGTYAYDGGGTRTRKIVSGVTTLFTWDPSNASLLVEGTTSDVYGPAGLIEQITGTTVTWHHHDQLGSTRILTDATGKVGPTFTFDAYGRLAATGSPVSGYAGAATTSFGYAGQYRDSETGLVYLRARYYDPVTAQFIGRDPVQGGSCTPSDYACNSPLNNVDLSGMACFIHNNNGGCLGAGVLTGTLNVVHTTISATGYAVQSIYSHSEAVSQVVGGLAIISYGLCGLTEGVGCGLGILLSSGSTWVSGLTVAKDCVLDSRGARSCGVAIASTAFSHYFSTPQGLHVGNFIPATGVAFNAISLGGAAVLDPLISVLKSTLSWYFGEPAC